MTTQTATLVGFLTARLDEDEQDAQYLDRSGAYTLQGAQNPARVLADVETKRRIVERCKSWQRMVRERPDDPFATAAVAVYETMLIDLVGVYADHPDYDTAWRP